MNLVLVDTCIFIDFFRGKESSAFEKLVLDNRVLLSPIVRLELLIGAKKDESMGLEIALQGLRQMRLAHDLAQESELLIPWLRGSGVAVGLPDIFLLAEAKLTSAPLWTNDKNLKRLCVLTGVAIYEAHG